MRKGVLPIVGLFGLGLLGTILLVVVVLVVMSLIGGIGFTLFQGVIFNIVAMCALLVLAWALIQSAGVSLAAGEGNLVMPLLMLFFGIGLAFLGISFIKPDIMPSFAIENSVIAPSTGENLSPNSLIIIIAGIVLLLYAASNKKLRNKLPKWVK